jgi:conjugal transfer pilus assembly protein TraV
MAIEQRSVSVNCINKVVIAASVVLSGCSIFPYSENFGCENMNQYGRCLDVKGAYDMAVTVEVKGEPISKKKGVRAEKESVDLAINEVAHDPQKQYQQERYRKLAQLVEAPSAPMVKQPEVVRTLVLNYSDRSRTGSPLYGHRFIYFFGSEPEWVMGPYTDKSQDALLPSIVE